MVYTPEDDDKNPGWCAEMSENGVGVFTNIWIFYAMVNVLSFIALVCWARSQYLAKTSGFYTPDAIVIFPVYLNILIATAITAIIQSTFFSSLYYAGINSGWMYSVSQGFMYGVSHVPVEGASFLLLCRGIGRSAMRKSAIFGISYGVFTWICIAIWFSSRDKRDENFVSRDTGIVVYYIWSFSGLMVFLPMWLAPNSGMFKRRPSAIYWGRFFGLMRLGLTIWYSFMLLHLDFAYCLNRFYGIVLFCGLRVWVTYRTFFLDTVWWHGIAVEVPVCYGAKIGHNAISNRGNESSSGSPLDGIALRGDTAIAMSSMLDGFGRGKASKVPLLDFAHLDMDSSKLLGVGSTARVYQGSWCGKKCAIKVLFTVDIVPEEISRVMLEASLLHSLQDASNNVIKLYGIAMLPPSLCVVLELCNEGSLSDVLYVKNAATQHGKASDFKFKLPWEERLDLILGACEGLAAFAKVLPGYSHNDIKSANYLVHDTTAVSSGEQLADEKKESIFINRGVKRNFVVKIADLEFASIGETPEHLHRVGNVANWTAPEVLGNKHPVSPASDVFSLAMTLYEIMVREVPFGDEKSVAKLYIEGNRPAFSHHSLTSDAQSHRLQTSQEVVSRKLMEGIVTDAWSQEPIDRPDILTMTNKVREIAKDYTKGLEDRRRSTFKGNMIKSETTQRVANTRSSGDSTTIGLVSTTYNGEINSFNEKRNANNVEIELKSATNEI